jgi:ketosteroid isomerase-like protein
MIFAPMDADAIFDEWERAWSGRDPAAFEAVCHPQLQYEDPLTPEPLHGTRALATHARRLWRAFPDARVNATGDRLAGGVHACAPCKLMGTHHGRLGRISPTGRFVVVHAVVYAEVREERLLRVRAFFDVYAPAVELGLLPRAGTAGERALLLLRGFGLRA